MSEDIKLVDFGELGEYLYKALIEEGYSPTEDEIGIIVDIIIEWFFLEKLIFNLEDE